MKKISILGGCGTVGRVATKILFSTQSYELTVCDKDREVFECIFGEISKSIKFKELDANIDESIIDAIKDADIVLNCIGPYYLYGPKILKQAIYLNKNYVDVCDDFDATIEDFKYDSLAKDKNISCLIGMGSSPGLANVIVKFAEKFLFDEITSIDIYHAHVGEIYEGPAVVKHRIHSMLSPIEFSVSYILHKRKELIEKYGPKEPQGCLKITIKRKKNGENLQYDFSIFSKGKGMGEGTGIPAAIGAILMSEGLVKGIGVNPPEAVLDPIDVFKLLFKILKGEKIPILIEKNKYGKKEIIEINDLLKEYLN